MMEGERGPNQFRCQECGEFQDFDPSWSEEDARREALSNGFDPDHCVLVCDSCFEELMGGRDEPERAGFQSSDVEIRVIKALDPG